MPLSKDLTLHFEGFVNIEIEVNKHFLSKERESKRGQEKETTGNDDYNIFKDKGIVELFSVHDFIPGHSYVGK